MDILSIGEVLDPLFTIKQSYSHTIAQKHERIEEIETVHRSKAMIVSILEKKVKVDDYLVYLCEQLIKAETYAKQSIIFSRIVEMLQQLSSFHNTKKRKVRSNDELDKNQKSNKNLKR